MPLKLKTQKIQFGDGKYRNNKLKTSNRRGTEKRVAQWKRLARHRKLFIYRHLIEILRRKTGQKHCKNQRLWQ